MTYEVIARHPSDRWTTVRALVTTLSPGDDRRSGSANDAISPTVSAGWIPEGYPHWTSSSYRDVFTIEWDPPDHVGQVRWHWRGEPYTRVGVSPIRIRPEEAGVYEFELRFRRAVDDAWLASTETITLATVPAAPRRVDAYRVRDQLVVEWANVDGLVPVDANRIYLSYADGHEEMHEVRGRERTELPLTREPIGLEVWASAVNDVAGEGGRRWLARVESLTLDVQPPERWLGYCSEHVRLGDPARITWYLRGGVAPYTVLIPSRDVTLTIDRPGFGEAYVRCARSVSGEEGEREEVAVLAVDAEGRSVLEAAWLYQQGSTPRAVPDRGSDAATIHDLVLYGAGPHEAYLGWDCIWIRRVDAPPTVSMLARW